MFRLENVSKVFKVGTFGGKELVAVDKVDADFKLYKVVVCYG